MIYSRCNAINITELSTSGAAGEQRKKRDADRAGAGSAERTRRACS